ncbi:MAG: hypothetical protein K6A44_04355 [bacterium]|nr:hypothetical protein [bacterium]
MLLIFVFAVYFVSPTAYASDGKVFHGYAEINEELRDDPEILSEIKAEVTKGHNVSMVVSNIINSETSSEGDEFFAEITSDVFTDKGVVLPAGTVAHGRITEIVEPKRFSRDANITLKFDYLATPDGREIPINAEMTTKRHPAKNAAMVTAEHAAYTVGGAALGSAVALNLFGVVGAVASHGYTVLGGAAIGGALGLGIVMSKKGDQVLLAPGDAINVKLIDNVNLPVFRETALIEEEVRNENLLVDITSIRLEKDPFGEPNTLTLGLNISNMTQKSLSTFDIVLQNENKAIFYASPFGDTGMWFTKIRPHSKISGKISFSVDNPAQKLWLVIMDSSNQKPLVKLSLNNSKRELSKNNSKNKKKKS